MLLLTAALPAFCAGTSTLYLSNTASGTTPAGMTLSTGKSSLTGWQPLATLGSGATTWLTGAQSLSIPAGTWNVILWTAPPSGSSVQRVDIVRTAADGTGATVLGSASLDILNTGIGNHPSTFSIALGAQTLANQRFAVVVTKTSGADGTLAFNGNDFPSRLEYPTGTVPPLVITGQPDNQTVYEGQSATFSVGAAASNGTLTYQWYLGTPASRVPIAGATSASYTTGALTVADNSNPYYHVIVKSPGAISLTSFNAKVTVLPAKITITRQSANPSVIEGQTATFSVEANSTNGVLSYQWYKGKAPSGVLVPGATSAAYTTPATVLSDSGAIYYVIVRGSAGSISITSYNAKLTVGPNTVAITTQPSNPSVVAGQTASLTVIASSTNGVLKYQWYKGIAPSGVLIPGATSATYTTPVTTAGDNGTIFYVIVGGSAGTTSVTSFNAKLTVVSAKITLTKQPSNQAVIVGQTASFAVIASSTNGVLNYQWYKGKTPSGVLIPGATAASYTTPATSLSDSPSYFYVIVGGSAGTTSVSSFNATLTVQSAVHITKQPVAQTVTIGQTATFSVTATTLGTASYQWCRAELGSSSYTPLSGATSASYKTAALTVAADNGAHFLVRVTDTSNNQYVDSTAALLTVTDGSTDNAHNPAFGPNVRVFQPTDTDIQSKLDTTYQAQKGLVNIGPGNQNDPQGSASAEMDDNRYAFLFKPGSYNADVKVGYYTHVVGLGDGPDNVTITGAVRTQDSLVQQVANPRGWNAGPGACVNFWRACENLAVTPTLGFIAYPEDDHNGMDAMPSNQYANTWAVSQAAPLRRIHINGYLRLWDHGWSSGGFMADSKVDGEVFSGSQQQWMTRSSSYGTWEQGLWNMVFVGCTGPTPLPTFTWLTQAVTMVPTVPTVMREKPFLTWDLTNGYSVVVPALRAAHSADVSWSDGSPAGTKLSLNTFYIAHSDLDTAQTINDQLSQGKHLFLTPGVYTLTDTIQVNNPDTVIYALGLPTLVAPVGKPALAIADVDGVKVAGELILDATVGSTTLLQVGAAATSAISHATNPTLLYDIVCRIGGARAGNAQTAVIINSKDVIGDNFWIWRADHGLGVGWTQNPCDTGVLVNGDNVTFYGLAVEHFNKIQTHWKGTGGKVYFYQSEIPYDVPSQAAYMDGSSNGYASYKVEIPAGVSNFTHEGHGLGVYSYYRDVDNTWTDHAFEAPTAAGITFEHLVTRWLNGGTNTGITHILNQTGDTATFGDNTDLAKTKGLY